MILLVWASRRDTALREGRGSVAFRAMRARECRGITPGIVSEMSVLIG